VPQGELSLDRKREQGPVLPYLVKSLGADANGYGRMMTAFGVVQFFGGLAAGPLADTLGGEVLVRVSPLWCLHV
jgi:MFS family permease